MKTAAAVHALLDRFDDLVTSRQVYRDGRAKALADLETVRADRDACAKAAANAQIEASKLRAKLEEVEAISIKHHTRALNAEEKVERYHESLTAHRAELKRRKVKVLPALPPSFDYDSNPF